MVKRIMRAARARGAATRVAATVVTAMITSPIPSAWRYTRSTILHSRMDLEVDAVRSVLGREAPIFGSYAGGEIAPLPSHYGDAADAGREFSGSLYHDHRVPARSLWSQARPGGRSLVTSISTTRSGDRREG
jgi:hypothetical protein